MTPFGDEWLKESEQDDYVPTEPARFARLLAKYCRFGPGFQARAQEAVRAYGAHAYLACCAMCGAAAESILLAAAIAQEKGAEEKVLKQYAAAGGRGRVERKLLGQVSDPVRSKFGGFATLLNYWRDEAAHGRASAIDDNEAFTSLALLLRFAAFVNDHWEEFSR